MIAQIGRSQKRVAIACYDFRYLALNFTIAFATLPFVFGIVFRFYTVKKSFF